MTVADGALAYRLLKKCSSDNRLLRIISHCKDEHGPLLTMVEKHISTCTENVAQGLKWRCSLKNVAFHQKFMFTIHI